MTMRDQVCFGYLNIAIQGRVGAVTVDPGFAGSEDDLHDWKEVLEWCWAKGFRLASENPALVTGDGTQIFLLCGVEPEPWRSVSTAQGTSGSDVPLAPRPRTPAW
jgi:hypothetical protein